MHYKHEIYLYIRPEYMSIGIYLTICDIGDIPLHDSLTLIMDYGVEWIEFYPL